MSAARLPVEGIAIRAPRWSDPSEGGVSNPNRHTGDLNPQLGLARCMNACARLLLHAATDQDPAVTVMAYLKEATGMAGVSLFRRQHGEDDGIAFDWLYQTTDGTMEGCRWSAETVASLADGHPAQFTHQDVCLADSARSEIPQGCAGLLIPIRVFGHWWGGMCLSDDDERLTRDEDLIQFLGTVADLFGVFFERRIASREDTESDKLAGALEMAGTVCHKLNQPMQVILGYASMVTSGDISEHDQICEIIQMIEDETRRMGIITKNLMGITQYRSVETREVGAMCDIDSQPALSE